jgi:hypothetical protein
VLQDRPDEALQSTPSWFSTVSNTVLADVVENRDDSLWAVPSPLSSPT